MRLREAYDFVRSAKAGAELEFHDAPYGHGPDAPASASRIEEPPEGPADAVPPPFDPAPFQRLGTLLYPEEAEAEPEPEELILLTNTILGDPAMDEVEHAANVEDWLIRILAYAGPSADPAIALVVAHFRWSSEAIRWDVRPEIGWLLERDQALQLLDEISTPTSGFYKGFLELSDPSPLRETLGMNMRAHEVLDLLNRIRSDAPYAETYLPKNRVDQWIGYINKDGKKLPKTIILHIARAAILVFAAAVLINFAVQVISEIPQSPWLN